MSQGWEQLDKFYNGNNMLFERHCFDAKKARDAEFAVVAERLRNMVGGSTGRKRAADEKVVIGVGLGDFASKMRLSSLHTPFLAYFVQKVFPYEC